MKTLFLAALATLLFTATASAQFINDRGPQVQPGRPDTVSFVAPDSISLPTGKPTPVLLHFRIAPGLHVNSHAPHDQFLIPTALTVTEGKGVRMVSVAYSQGRDLTLPADPKTKLEVYSGDFAIDATLIAEPGRHLLEGKLRYQACDQSQCMPPKTIPVAIEVVGTK